MFLGACNINVKDGKCCNTVEEKSEKKRDRPRRTVEEIERGSEEWLYLAHDSCKPLENYSVHL